MRIKTTFLILAILFFSNSLKAQQDEYGRWINGVSGGWSFDERLPQEEIEIAKTRWRQIAADNENKCNEWAGDYKEGSEVAGSYLRLSAQNGYVIFGVNKCAAQVQNISYGKVVVTATALILHPEFNTRKVVGKNKFASPELLSVKWRNVPYLIYKSQIRDFANYAAGFPQEDYFFSAINAKEVGSSEDSPIFPQGYERFVRKAINGEIITVGKRTIELTDETYPPSYRSRTSVSVNVGASDGAKKGMRFYILGSGINDQVEIVSVGTKTSKGFVIRSVDDESSPNPLMRKDDSDLVTLTAGVAITTNIYKHLELISTN